MVEIRYPYLSHPDRIEALGAADLLGAAADEDFDRLTRLASTVLHAPVALVSLVSHDRQYLKGCLGLPEPWASARETPLSHSFCQHVVTSNDVLIIEDARKHPLVSENLAIRDLDVVAYAGIPLVTSTGQVLGSFCVIDTVPRVWTEREILILRDLAASVMTEIELRIVARDADRKGREWQALLDFSVEGVFGMDMKGVCTYINESALKLLGYTAQECLGRNMHDMVHYKHPDGTPYPMEECPIYQAAMSARPARLIEEVLWRKDGTPLTALYSCAPIRENDTTVGAVVTMVDVSELKQAETALELRATQLRALADATLVINSTATLEALVQAVADQSRDIIGAHCSRATLKTPGPGADVCAVSRSGTEGRADENTPHRCPPFDTNTPSSQERQPHDEELAVPLLGRDGSQFGLLRMVRKLEGGFTPEDEAILVQLARIASVAVENMRLLEQTQEAVRLRNEFLTSVSHDLKNPLVAIKGTAQLLARRVRRAGRPDQQDLTAGLDRISDAGTRMAAQIEELLDLSRLQMGDPLDLSLQPLDLVPLARRVAEEHRLGSEKHDVQVESEIESLECVADLMRIERVLGNLVANAVKYSPDGGRVRVRISRQPSSGRPLAVIEVQDEGVGIPEADLPHIFERFHRAGNVTGRIRGTGVGLSSSRQIIEQHGGSISVSSQEGRGSTFTILLPLQPENDRV